MKKLPIMPPVEEVITHEQRVDYVKKLNERAKIMCNRKTKWIDFMDRLNSLYDRARHAGVLDYASWSHHTGVLKILEGFYREEPKPVSISHLKFEIRTLMKLKSMGESHDAFRAEHFNALAR